MDVIFVSAPAPSRLKDFTEMRYKPIEESFKSKKYNKMPKKNTAWILDCGIVGETEDIVILKREPTVKIVLREALSDRVAFTFSEFIEMYKIKYNLSQQEITLFQNLYRNRYHYLLVFRQRNKI